MDTLICEGEMVEINSLVYISTPLNVTKDYNLTWQTNPSLTVTSDSTAEASPLVSTLYYTTVDDGKCTGNMDSVLVELKLNPVTAISPKNQTICKGVQAEITATGGQNYLWNISGSIGTETTENKRTISSNNSTFVAVQAIDAPCRGLWDTAFVTVDTTDVLADFTVLPKEGFTLFEPTVQNLSYGGELYDWDFGNGDIRTITQADDAGVFGGYFPTYPLAGEYDIILRASRASGCVDSTSKSITVYKKFILEIPNAFSPNGDNLNETFNVITIAGVQIQGSIYNQWGEKVYEWDTNKEENNWDGMYKGKPVQMGVYLYTLKLLELDRTVHYKKGAVTLVR
jgi:gliding motility-associated-like protein